MAATLYRQHGDFASERGLFSFELFGLESVSEDALRGNGEEFDDNMTKAEASKRIDELRTRSPSLADEA
jgi:hypothetical protein